MKHPKGVTDFSIYTISHLNLRALNHSTDLVSVSPAKSKMYRMMMKIVDLQPAALLTPARPRIRHN